MSKKTLVAVAVLSAFAGSAFAADVQVYGRIDTGLYFTDNKAADTKTLTMESGIAGASRFGIKGSEKLANGVTIGFQLENGFKADDGSMVGSDEGRLWDRDAYLYIKTPKFGDVRIGRSGALGGGVSGGIFAGTASPFGVVYKDAASTKIFAVESRVDNQVRYDTPEFGGLKLHFQYSNGMELKDDVNNSQKDRYAAVGATYNIGDLKVVAVVDKVLYNDRPYNKNTDKTGKKDHDDKDSFKLAAQYKFAPATIYFGYQHSNNTDKAGIVTVSSADTDAVTLGTRVKLWGGNLNASVGYVKGDSDKEEIKGKQAALGYTYNLSKRTVLYSALAYYDSDYEKDGEVVKGKTKDTTIKSVMAGIYHAF